MAKNRKQIPTRTRARLQQEINSQCPLCDDMNVDHFEVHHIDEVPDNNDYENLLMICPICHSKISKGDISREQIAHVKGYLGIKNATRKLETPRTNSISIKGTVSNSTIANSVNAKTIVFKSKSKPKIEFAEGAIGRNAEKKNYVKHLIDRYNEFKEWDVGRSKMKYQFIWGAIKKQFKASAYQIPESQFNILVEYLTDRIDKTKLGKMNRGAGIKNYSTFEEVYDQSKVVPLTSIER